MTVSPAKRRLDAVRSDVEAVVARAIDEEQDPTALPKLVSVERVASAEFRPVGDPSPLHVRDSEHHGGQRYGEPAYVVVRHTLPLTLTQLQWPPMEEIRDWATAARRVARDVVLSEIMHAAKHVDNDTEKVKAVVPLANHFHHLRLIAFKHRDGNRTCATLPTSWEWSKASAGASKAERTFNVTTVSVDRPVDGGPSPKVRGLLFEVCGGPVVYRCSDLALTDEETDDHGVRLVLEEKFRLAVGSDGCTAVRALVDT